MGNSCHLSWRLPRGVVERRIARALARGRILASVVWATLCVVSGEVRAEIVEEIVQLPVEVADAKAVVIRHAIKVSIFRDKAAAHSAFMVLNHGRAADAKGRRAVKSAAYAANARYFASLGYAVFMPIRIGYGETGGPDVENSGPCANRNYRPAYEAGAVQSLAVIAYAKSLPYIDPERGLVVGQSFGGTIAMALAAKSIAGVQAAVNFSGGGGGRPKTHPAQPCSHDRMAQLFASYGSNSRIPTLWLYSENDQYWGPDIPKLWHKAFVERGGTATFIQLPAYKADGHPSFTGAPNAWRPAFEKFVGGCCTRGRP